MKKNVASQAIGAQMITAADGTAFTGAVSVLYTIDNGTQTAGAGTAPAHEGNGYHSYTPTQAETNGDHVAFTFTGTGAIPATIQVFTRFPQSVDNATGIADTPTVSEFNARTLVSADYTIVSDLGVVQTGDTYALANGATGFAAIDTVVDAILVDTAEIGTAGAGLTNITLNAASVDLIWDENLAGHQTVLSAGRATSLGGVPIAETTATGTPTTTSISLVAGSTVDNYYRDATFKILGGAGIGQARIITTYTGSTRTCIFDEAFTVAPINGDAIAISIDHLHPISQIQDGLATSTEIAALPTVSQLNARTLVAADYFDPAVDVVANVTLVATTTTNTDMRGTDNAATAAQVAAELATYDGPTNAEMVARTPTAAQLAYMVANASTGLPVTFTTSGGSTTTAVINLVDGAAASATNDQYNGRLLVFTDGTLKGVVTDITDYVGSTTTATITAIPTAPTASHNARLI